MKQTPLTPIAIAAALFCGAGHSAEIEPGTADFGTKLRLAGFGEGPRDLGLTRPDGTPIDADAETAEGFAEIQPTLYWRMSENWTTFIRAQGFVPSGEIVVTDEESPQRTESYAGLREAWIEYSGLTSYPNEVLRVGRQRLRYERDATWWDRDVEAVRWIFDTTLFQTHWGIATQLHTFRTGDWELPASQRDRAYALAGMSGQWNPTHFFGVRGAYAMDYADLDEETARAQDPLRDEDDEEPKLAERRYGWVGAYMHNGYYTMPERAGLYYWAQADLLFGNREDVILPGPDATDPTVQRTDRNVTALAGDVGLRLHFPAPFAMGVAYAYGQGGGDPERSETFEQTGLHSNRSRFTGTRSLMYRFNEALQPDLSNIRVASAFISIPTPRFDANLVYHHFTRDDVSVPVETDGLDVQPTTTDNFLGHGYDLVLAIYFGSVPSWWIDDREDLRSNVRLRGSLFQPGDTYGDDLEDQYRTTLELTLWF
ncbi:MAG: alginate export family protein [Gammaproteobacteria bacterium]